VRIIMSSPTLRQATLEYRPHAVNVELAKRLGVDIAHRRLKLVSRGMGIDHHDGARRPLEQGVDWEDVGIDGVVARLEATSPSSWVKSGTFGSRSKPSACPPRARLLNGTTF